VVVSFYPLLCWFILEGCIFNPSSGEGRARRARRCMDTCITGFSRSCPELSPFSSFSSISSLWPTTDRCRMHRRSIMDHGPKQARVNRFPAFFSLASPSVDSDGQDQSASFPSSTISACMECMETTNSVLPGLVLSWHNP
jgi:hypothetical protein